MDFNDLVLCFAVVFRDKCEIWSLLPTVEHRYFHHLCGGNFDVIELSKQAAHLFAKLGVPNLFRAVVNHQRAVGWNRLNDSVDSAFGKCNIKRADCGVDLAADLVAELDGHRGIAGQQKAHIAHQISSFLVQAAAKCCPGPLTACFIRSRHRRKSGAALLHRDRYAGAARPRREGGGRTTDRNRKGYANSLSRLGTALMPTNPVSSTTMMPITIRKVG